MKTLKICMVLTLVLISFTGMKAQESVEADFGVGVVSSYAWRGMKLDDAAAQPSLSLGYKGLSLGAWGSVGLTGGDYKELDFSLSYKKSGFFVGLTDYWCADSQKKYFDYSDNTLHVLEAGLGYDFSLLSISWYSNILGATGQNSDGDDVMSSYVEVSAPFSFGDLDWTATVGAAPFESSYYGVDGFGIINCSLTASKDLTIGSATIPAFVQLMANPDAEKMFFTFGVSF